MIETALRRIIAAGGGIWLALAAGPAAAEPSGPGRHHVSVDSGAYPWSSLVKLFNSVGGSCTGAVLARDRVLTAGHCLYAFRTRRFLPPEALHVLLGYDRGDYRVHARVTRYRLGPGYDPKAERATAGSDWAVLDLADPLPPDVRPLKVAASPPTAGDGRMMLAGFARDRAYVVTADDDCRVTGLIDGGGLIAHDCVIQPGDSGAPLLRQGAGDIAIVGVAVGIWHVGRGQVGIAAPLPARLTTDDGTR